MRKAIAIAATTLALLPATAMPLSAESYPDWYVNASQTYQLDSPNEYDTLYHHVRAKDKTAARKLVEAAKDTCTALDGPDAWHGPRSSTPFVCSNAI